MAAEKTRSDSLREYLTGASSDGGAQADPDASLGNYRSSSEADSFDIAVTNPITGLTVESAGGGNTEGAGTLDVIDASTIQWKCYGGSYGDEVEIANGETKIIETDGDSGAFVRVERTSAAALSGTATVTLTRKLNNVFGLDDVSSAEATAGDLEYRGTIIVNESGDTVSNFKRYIGELGTSAVSDDTQLGASGAGTIVTTGSLADWPESGFCHIRDGATTEEIVYYSSRTDTVLTVPAAGREMLGTTASAGSASDTIHAVPGIAVAIDTAEVTAGGAAIQTIADEDTAPTSVTWDTGITAATGLSIGTMTTTQQVGIWIKRQVPAGAVVLADAAVLIEDSFDVT